MMREIAKLFGRLGRAQAGKAIAIQAPKMEPRLIHGGASSPYLSPQAWDTTEFAMDWTHKRITQLKVDGIQANYIDGQIVSREGTPLNCARHCLGALQRLEEAMGVKCVFNAEYVEDAGFNATIAAMRKGTGQGVLWIYDFAPLEFWVTGAWDCAIEDRLSLLAKRISECDSPFVGALDFWMLNGAETKAMAQDVWKSGYEGLVSKTPGSIYRRDRTIEWLKVKQVITATGKAFDYGLRADGQLGKIWVRPYGENKPICVATGWSAQQGHMIKTAIDMGKPPAVVIVHERTAGGDRSMRGARFAKFDPAKAGSGK